MSDAQPAPTEDEQRSKAELLVRLDALGKSLAKTREEAIKARADCGIEFVWMEDEEHYEGIDDLNRDLVRSAWQSKPPGQAVPQPSDTKSTEFVNITRPYVDAAASKVGDILLPTDDRSWSLSETPVPELIDRAKGISPEAVQGMQQAGVPADKQAQVAQIEQQQAQAAQSMIDEAKAKAKKAEKRIEDWQVEGQWHAEVRKVIDDCARIGSGILKGPIPAAKRSQMFKDNALVIVDEIKPVSKRVDPWNFFPDGACGESIHNGSYVWERDFVTSKQLEEMKRDPDYVASQIDACLAEGPQKRSTTRKTADGRELDDKTLFEIWYFHGQAKKADLEAAGCECKSEAVSIPAIFTMVNDRVIKGALNPLDSGEFPYDLMPWQRRKNMPWGTGVGRQIRTPQRIVVAGTRTMLTNAGRAAGPVFVIKNGVLTAADGSNEITPWKIFYAGEDDTTDDVNKAMAMFTIPSLQKELMAIVQFGLKMAEDVTGLPLLLQGQSGGAPDTYGGQQLVEKNASGTLHRIALLFDDCITEPHIRRYYAWLLQYGEDDEKGEFVIDARGSTVLVEREVYKQEVTQLLQAALQPAFGLNPKKVMEEHLRSTKKDPKNFQYSEDEEKQLQEQQSKQKPQDPAALRVEGDLEKERMRQEADKEEFAFKAAEAQKDREHEMKIAQLNWQSQAMALSAKSGMNLDQIKAKLADTTMKLATQTKLAARSKPAPQVATPPTEPAGRAPDGQSFQR
jgi:hypothetical protein